MFQQRGRSARALSCAQSSVRTNGPVQHQTTEASNAEGPALFQFLLQLKEFHGGSFAVRDLDMSSIESQQQGHSMDVLQPRCLGEWRTLLELNARFSGAHILDNS